MLTKPQKVVMSFAIAAVLVIIILSVIAFSPKTPDIISNISSTDLIFYYGITCPHCKNVEQWVEENNFTQKVELTQKEVYLNTTNAQELLAVGKSCKLQKGYLGAVPLAYYNETCYLGDVDIINFFKTKIGAQ